MNAAPSKPLIYLVAVLVVCGTWFVIEHFKIESSRYSIESGGALQRTFLLDKKTGRVWRYYVNMDESKNPTSEGFQLIKE